MKIYNQNPKNHQLDFKEKTTPKIIKIFFHVALVIVLMGTFPFSIIPGFLIFIYLKNRKKKRDLMKGAVEIITNTPPDNLRPAEIGFMHDHTQGPDEIIAILFYLISEGYISMDVIESKQLLDAGNYRLTLKNKDFSKLRKYEITFIKNIFESEGFIMWEDFKSQKLLGVKLSVISFELQQEMQKRGYYYFYEGFDNERYTEAMQKVTKNLASSLIKSILNMGMGISENITDKGKNIWSSVDGFKRYLETVEKNRVIFQADPEKQMIYIGDMMPYATALHVNDIWQWELMGIEQVNAE